jgi:hypothetical protein
MNDQPDQLDATADLLSQVFGDGPTTTLPYLSWLYRSNPCGFPYERNVEDTQGRSGHYAVIPQVYAGGADHWRACLSLNTAVAPRAQGKGLFVKLASQVIEDAAADGVCGVLGVSNRNSTPGFVRRLGFSVIRSLPTRLGVGLGAARSERLHEGDEAISAIARFECNQMKSAGAGPSQMWTEAMLRWRLNRPGASYVVLAGNSEGVVATHTLFRGVRFTVIVATFSDRSKGANVMPLIAAAMRRTRGCAFVYAGWNVHVPVYGLPLPRQLKPSPLNLIWRPTTVQAFEPRRLRRFEFLDFDAY